MLMTKESKNVLLLFIKNTIQLVFFFTIMNIIGAMYPGGDATPKIEIILKKICGNGLI